MNRTIGGISDSSVVVFNSSPYLEIEYPIPYKLKEYSKKSTRITSNDVIKKGLNFYDMITEIRLRENEVEKINTTEESELISILRGGVIYNGSWS